MNPDSVIRITQKHLARYSGQLFSSVLTENGAKFWLTIPTGGSFPKKGSHFQANQCRPHIPRFLKLNLNPCSPTPCFPVRRRFRAETNLANGESLPASRNLPRGSQRSARVTPGSAPKVQARPCSIESTQQKFTVPFQVPAPWNTRWTTSTPRNVEPRSSCTGGMENKPVGAVLHSTLSTGTAYSPHAGEGSHTA